MELAQLLHQVSAELDRRADQLLRQRWGISHSQLAFMSPLLREGTMDVTALAAATDVSVPAISKRTLWFVHRGYLRMDTESAKGRRVLLSLTDRGAELASHAVADLATELSAALSNLPPAGRERLIAALLELQQAITASPTP